MIELETIARSQTECAYRVQQARILLAYRTNPSTYAVGEAIGVTPPIVQQCLDRAVRFGVMAALDDSPRPGSYDAKVVIVAATRHARNVISVDRRIRLHDVIAYTRPRNHNGPALLVALCV